MQELLSSTQVMWASWKQAVLPTWTLLDLACQARTGVLANLKASGEGWAEEEDPLGARDLHLKGLQKPRTRLKNSYTNACSGSRG